MSQEIEELRKELEASVGPTLHWTNTRARIHELHGKAKTFEERGQLLKIYVTLMNAVERMELVKDVETFRETRRKDYNLLLIVEATDGKDIVPSKLLAVTRREIAAGHIDEKHELYQLALADNYVPTPRSPQKSWWARLMGWD
jgi:hypothetical protein